MSVLKYKDKDGNWQTLGGVMAKQINVVQTTGTSIDDVMSQNAVSELLNDKSDTGHTHLLSGVTDVTAPLAGINSITGAVGTMAFQNAASYLSATEVNTALGDKASQSDLETVSGTVTSHTASINDLSGQSETIAAALVNLNENKSDTGHTHSQYLTGITSSQVTTALGFTPANNTAFTAHTANTSVHISQSLLDEIDALKKAIYSENGYEYVEIGGVKWATMNIGATSVTDYGQYFQWGSTTGFLSGDVGSNSSALKKPFGWSDYKFGNGKSSPGASGMTKYNSGDTKTVLDLSDDTAHANWGGSWRMPTTEEFVALGNAVNTAWTADYQGSGVAGMICTAKDGSGAQLFFPAAGYCDLSSVYDAGSFGYYWSSSLFSSDMQNAYFLNFGNVGVGWQYNFTRYSGFLVRGVVG